MPPGWQVVTCPLNTTLQAQGRRVHLPNPDMLQSRAPEPKGHCSTIPEPKVLLGAEDPCWVQGEGPKQAWAQGVRGAGPHTGEDSRRQTH